MSGAGENRWRRGGSNRQPQDRSSGTNTPTKESGRQQGAPGLPGNAWAVGKGKGGAGGAPLAQSAQAEQHVPVKDFNAAEVKDFLKKGYDESVTGNHAVYQKVQGDSVGNRTGGVWGIKGNMAHLMPNGQDFLTQLKKQLHNLEQGK